MPEFVTSILLAILTALSLVASAVAAVRLRKDDTSSVLRRLQHSLLGVCVTGTGLLFVYRTIYVPPQIWQPLGSHVDGLLLIATLFAAAVLFVQRASVQGLTAFALPLLTILLAWSICASAWTYEPFKIESVWTKAHKAGVYLGSLFFCIAAAAGMMYLYIQRRLQRHQRPGPGQHLASLEATEQLIIRTATLGFALLTFGLVCGLILVVDTPHTSLGPTWWLSPKVILAALVWLIYAIVMNVRFATAFRGTRAAWLSIVGVILIMAIFGVVNTLSDEDDDQPQFVDNKKIEVDAWRH